MSAFHDKVRKQASTRIPDFPLRLLFREVAAEEAAGERFLGLVSMTDTEIVVVTSRSVHVIKERLIGAKSRSWALADIDAVSVDQATLVLRLADGDLVGLQFAGRADPDAPTHAKNAWTAHDLIARQIDP